MKKIFIVVLFVLLTLPIISAEPNEKLYTPIGIMYIDYGKELYTCTTQIYTKGVLSYKEYADKVCYC